MLLNHKNLYHCKSKIQRSKPRISRNGGLAHLARALDWQSKGGRFDPDILHNHLFSDRWFFLGAHFPLSTPIPRAPALPSRAAGFPLQSGAQAVIIPKEVLQSRVFTFFLLKKLTVDVRIKVTGSIYYPIKIPYFCQSRKFRFGA